MELNPPEPLRAKHSLGALLVAVTVALGLLWGAVWSAPTPYGRQASVADMARALLGSEGAFLGALLASNVALIAVIVTQAYSSGTAKNFASARNALGRLTYVVSGLALASAIVVILGAVFDPTLAPRLFSYCTVTALIFTTGLFGRTFVLGPIEKRLALAAYEIKRLRTFVAGSDVRPRPKARAASIIIGHTAAMFVIATIGFAPAVSDSQDTSQTLGLFAISYAFFFTFTGGINIFWAALSLQGTTPWIRRSLCLVGCVTTLAACIAVIDSLSHFPITATSFALWMALPTSSVWMRSVPVAGRFSLGEAIVSVACLSAERRIRSLREFSAGLGQDEAQLLAWLQRPPHT